MSALLAATKAVHYASVMVVFGELMFAVVVASPGWNAVRRAGFDAASDRRIFAVIRWSVFASIVSALAWFAIAAAEMGGAPIARVLDRETVALVLGETVFGRVWSLRGAIAVALCAVLLALGRSPAGPRQAALAIVATATAGAYLGSLALTGHALAGLESGDAWHLASDVAHLLAAGAWLGALPALVRSLGDDAVHEAATRAARRFSTTGLASVGVLIASGLANAWYLVGGVPALIGTDYGRILLAKVALFALMLAIAVANRGYLVVRIAGGDREALRPLRRNAMLELAAGIAVVVIVSLLGLTVPAVHQSPVWPFERSLAWQPIERLPLLQMTLTAAGMVACIGAALAVHGALARPPRLRIAALAAIAIPAGIFAWLLAVPAYPTTYALSPVRYTVDAIASGASLYAAHCAGCHDRGAGDSAAAGSKPPPVAASATASTPTPTPTSTPASLVDRVPYEREGDLFWRIAHGVPNTAMPAFASKLNDTEVWNLVQFLDAQAEAVKALPMTDRVTPLLNVAAPEFSFEMPGRVQESFARQREGLVKLLVLYTLPESAPRLRELARQQRAIAAAGGRVIAVAIDPASAMPREDAAHERESIIAIADPSVARAYAMFARRVGESTRGARTHVEFLVDRHGSLRVRRIGVPDADAAGTALLAQIARLVAEPPEEPVKWGHRH